MADDMLGCENFERHIGTTFVMTDEAGQATDLVLTEASALGSSLGAGQRAQFSVLFKSSEATIRPQAIYLLSHAEMGDMTLFLVPVAQDKAGVSYEACFG
ncbi:DUF6916 family protein [Sphingomonas sp.]|uniref:DUF6916 family protein n=1 Tax=Sphingomonas sp. TaxID=28214 RepID=UPI003D6D011F